MVLRRIARPLLAAVVVRDGLRALRHPRQEVEHVPNATERLDTLAERLPVDRNMVVRGLGLVKIAAGVLLGLGVAPRVAAGVAAVLHVPTVVGAHPFWERGRDRGSDLTGLVTDAAVLGGLLLAAADTSGKPSLAWRAEHVAKDASKTAKHVAKDATRRTKRATRAVVTSAERDVAKLEAKVERTARRTSRKARRTASRIERDLREARASVENAVNHAVKDVAEGVKDRAHAV